MANDMTKGSIIKHVISFSIPVMITLLCQTLFSTADQMMMGRYVDQTALGSIASCSSTILLFMMLANGFAIGYKIVIGQYFGAKRYRHVKEAIYTSLFIMGGLTLFLSVAGFFFSPFLLRLLGTVSNLYDGAVLYLKYYFLCIGLIIFRSGVNNLYYALGETKIPMYFQIAQICVHILMDYVLLKYLHMGIPGLVLAGLIGRLTTFVPLLIILLKRIRPYPKVRHLFNLGSFRKIVTYALPSCLANSVGAVQQLAVTNLINSCGAAVVTGNAIASNINNICFIITNAVGSAAGSFAAQNYGAHNLHRIKRCAFICAAINLAYCLLTIVIVALFGPTIISWYLAGKYEPAFYDQVMDFAQYYLLVISYFYLVYGVGHVSNEMLRSVGKIKITTIAMIFQICVRVGIGYGFMGLVGPHIIPYSIVFAWMACYVFTTIYFYMGRWIPHFKGMFRKHEELQHNRESLKEQLNHINQ